MSSYRERLRGLRGTSPWIDNLYDAFTVMNVKETIWHQLLMISEEMIRLKAIEDRLLSSSPTTQVEKKMRNERTRGNARKVGG